MVQGGIDEVAKGTLNPDLQMTSKFAFFCDSVLPYFAIAMITSFVMTIDCLLLGAGGFCFLFFGLCVLHSERASRGPGGTGKERTCGPDVAHTVWRHSMDIVFTRGRLLGLIGTGSSSEMC